ncbi:saxitoxin and tetrodotoxin-binding protein 2-like [Salarias fasciatus]|uniref:saxitoxin and tetrodotoxin-binding protein 2-like n=1 Tax=Salarias fasciatus TaxID=181472 RepID=UPI001176A164|nr:saxitoxin and tetrodotoxin-binding protein 2-like [Salarias fasciatus]
MEDKLDHDSATRLLQNVPPAGKHVGAAAPKLMQSTALAAAIKGRRQLETPYCPPSADAMHRLLVCHFLLAVFCLIGATPTKEECEELLKPLSLEDRSVARHHCGRDPAQPRILAYDPLAGTPGDPRQISHLSNAPASICHHSRFNFPDNFGCAGGTMLLGFADHDAFTTMLEVLEKSHISIKQKGVVSFTAVYHMLPSSENSWAIYVNSSGTDFGQTARLMNLNIQLEGDFSAQALYFYAKNITAVTDADQERFLHQASCLGFTGNSTVTYDEEKAWDRLAAPASISRPSVSPQLTEQTGLSHTETECPIAGAWVLVWAVADADQRLVGTVSSSHLEIGPLTDNTTMDFTERNVYLSNKTSCTQYRCNMTVVQEDNLTIHGEHIEMDTDGVSHFYNETADVDVYSPGNNSLLLVYRASQSGRYVLSYRKEGHHRAVDQQTAEQELLIRFAECLKIPTEQPYVYDGVSDFCHKKSAPEAEPAES